MQDEEKRAKKSSLVERFGVVESPFSQPEKASQDWYTDRLQDECATKAEDGYQRRTSVQHVHVGEKYAKLKKKYILMGIGAVLLLIIAVAYFANNGFRF